MLAQSAAGFSSIFVSELPHHAPASLRTPASRGRADAKQRTYTHVGSRVPPYPPTDSLFRTTCCASLRVCRVPPALHPRSHPFTSLLPGGGYGVGLADEFDSGAAAGTGIFSSLSCTCVDPKINVAGCRRNETFCHFFCLHAVVCCILTSAHALNHKPHSDANVDGAVFAHFADYNSLFLLDEYILFLFSSACMLAGGVSDPPGSRYPCAPPGCFRTLPHVCTSRPLQFHEKSSGFSDSNEEEDIFRLIRRRGGGGLRGGGVGT